jgi:hypothetical protein
MAELPDGPKLGWVPESTHFPNGRTIYHRDIDSALSAGWVLEKSSSQRDYFMLLPPPKSKARGFGAQWDLLEYEGKNIMVPDYLEKVLGTS